MKRRVKEYVIASSAAGLLSFRGDKVSSKSMPGRTEIYPVGGTMGRKSLGVSIGFRFSAKNLGRKLETDLSHLKAWVKKVHVGEKNTVIETIPSRFQ